MGLAALGGNGIAVCALFQCGRLCYLRKFGVFDVSFGLRQIFCIGNRDGDIIAGDRADRVTNFIGKNAVFIGLVGRNCDGIVCCQVKFAVSERQFLGLAIRKGQRLAVHVRTGASVLDDGRERTEVCLIRQIQRDRLCRLIDRRIARLATHRDAEGRDLVARRTFLNLHAPRFLQSSVFRAVGFVIRRHRICKVFRCDRTGCVSDLASVCRRDVYTQIAEICTCWEVNSHGAFFRVDLTDRAIDRNLSDDGISDTGV